MIIITDLLLDNGKISGAVCFHVQSGEAALFKASAVVIAPRDSSFSKQNIWKIKLAFMYSF